jgi:hypothetical protein
MSTATAEPRTKVTFIARSHNLVLTRKQPRHVEDGMGGKMVRGEQEAREEIERLNRVREANGKEPEPIDGIPWKVEFVNSTYSPPEELSDEDYTALVEWLRAHPKFNTSGPSGFYELGKAPDEPRPTPAEQHREIRIASLNHDLPRAEAALEVERQTHNRPDILEAAEAAVREISELLADGGQSAP